MLGATLEIRTGNGRSDCPVCNERAVKMLCGVLPYNEPEPDDYSPLRPGLPLVPDWWVEETEIQDG
ncbi:hypothetical protein H6F43_03695 [Leptolyngbya sp. FACHB-36]|uniref:hypothetical protein n=1 Tax=Leptolyngbya sp. FACHB-36 TaxID=2692808 RepID=UPI00167FF6FB|nr:hypothetical protein [Leptolyngbya sp. FACHB-36]MBD2019285.1 hypothetical protein [Leptolyngbya sp. FACHB-36]